MKTNLDFFDKHSQCYGFALGSTRSILYRLKNVDCCYVVFPNNLDHYLDMLLHDQPQYILGLRSDGNSYGDVVDGKIRQLIDHKKLRSKFIFLYIPKGAKSWITSQEIDLVLQRFKLQR